MALKFLNKKGWHTGSLRNIENVWKAEQKHDAEQKKLEELRKQIQEERERQEFRVLQERAGLAPRQERLEFLYDSGLAVGKGSGSDGFKSLEALPSTSSAEPAQKQSSAPGALFEDKPHSANDAWRKLHSDPLLMIRQREQEALSRVKNNPVQMAMIRKSVVAKKHKENGKKEGRKKHSHSESKKRKHSSSEKEVDLEDGAAEAVKRKDGHKDKLKQSELADSEHELIKRNRRNEKHHSRSLDVSEKRSGVAADKRAEDSFEGYHEKSDREKRKCEGQTHRDSKRDRESRGFTETRSHNSATLADPPESRNKRRNVISKLSEEEQAARLREMQLDAELHEEQRWKRIKKADEKDAREAAQSDKSTGRNFLDAAQKSMYGTEKGGSSTIEESIRRRTNYSQGRSEAREGNAFRR